MTFSFEALFYPVSVKTFTRTYLQKAPLHLSGMPERAQGLFSAAQFFEGLSDCENVRAVFPELKQARIAPNDARDMFDAGATICATGVERAHAHLSSLTRQIKDVCGFSGDVSIRAYYSPSGAGFGKHFDTRTVTTLQIEGTKRWWFCTEPAEPFPLLNSPLPLTADLEAHLKRTKVESTVLMPGDLLCLPPGAIHWAEAGSKSLALNLAFDYIHDGVADYLALHLKKRLLRDARFRQAAVLPLDDSGRSSVSEAIEAAIGILKEAKTDPAVIYKE